MSTKLDAYPCPVGLGMCYTECAEALDRCEAVTCRFLDVYRQAIADHRCARLLRVFERRASQILLRCYMLSSEQTHAGWTRLTKLVDAIRDALRAAGLETE